MSNTVWSKFYWADWSNDPCLRLCSLAAQGLWMRMLCLAAGGEPFGYLVMNGKGLSETDIAKLAGASESEVSILMAELADKGVFSRDRHGRIYSRRMIRDAKNQAESKKNGKRGGNPTLCKTTTKSQGVNPPFKPRDNTQEPYANSQEPIHITSPSSNVVTLAKVMDARDFSEEVICFPLDGPIEYAKGPWAKIVRSKGKNMDPDTVAEAFRKFCRKESISLGKPNIVQVFDSFCEKHRMT